MDHWMSYIVALCLPCPHFSLSASLARRPFGRQASYISEKAIKLPTGAFCEK